jgi:hypothetical protein
VEKNLLADTLHIASFSKGIVFVEAVIGLDFGHHFKPSNVWMRPASSLSIAPDGLTVFDYFPHG